MGPHPGGLPTGARRSAAPATGIEAREPGPEGRHPAPNRRRSSRRGVRAHAPRHAPAIVPVRYRALDRAHAPGAPAPRSPVVAVGLGDRPGRGGGRDDLAPPRRLDRRHGGRVRHRPCEGRPASGARPGTICTAIRIIAPARGGTGAFASVEPPRDARTGRAREERRSLERRRASRAPGGRRRRTLRSPGRRRGRATRRFASPRASIEAESGVAPGDLVGRDHARVREREAGGGEGSMRGTPGPARVPARARWRGSPGSGRGAVRSVRTRIGEWPGAGPERPAWPSASPTTAPSRAKGRAGARIGSGRRRPFPASPVRRPRAGAPHRRRARPRYRRRWLAPALRGPGRAVSGQPRWGRPAPQRATRRGNTGSSSRPSPATGPARIRVASGAEQIREDATDAPPRGADDVADAVARTGALAHPPERRMRKTPRRARHRAGGTGPGAHGASRPMRADHQRSATSVARPGGAARGAGRGRGRSRCTPVQAPGRGASAHLPVPAMSAGRPR